MPRLLIIYLTLSFITYQGYAQSKLSEEDTSNWKWKKHRNYAEEMYAESQYAKAAIHFEQAWLKKPKKLDLIQQAGTCYFIVKDYEKAIEAFGFIKDQTKKYPKAKLNYALALKQNEQYELAVETFRDFANNYTDEDAANLVARAMMELEGCEKAKEYQANPNREVRITHADKIINSEFTEFAPTPFGNERILFSSTKMGKAKIFETSKGFRSWDGVVVPAQFTSLEDHHVCNATYTSDEKRIYFTVCKSVENWGYLTTRCEIYVTQKNGTLWGAPERLPETINQEGITSTQPSVIQDGDKEILYFASNRTGGQGGMDIWYTSREMSDEGFNFDPPRNAGAKVNTANNELTPFFDVKDGILYFSSDGHIGMGGLDIFKIKGNRSIWEKPNNLGSPFNSGADDYFYVENRYGDGGFFVSNRTYPPNKMTSAHEDIFEFKITGEPSSVVIKGTVYDELNNIPVQGVEVSIYEIVSDQQTAIIERQVFDNGSYFFQLAKNQTYKIIADKAGYQPTTMIVNPNNIAAQIETLYLKPNSNTSSNSVISTPENSIPTPSAINPINTETPSSDASISEPSSRPIMETVTEYTYTPSTDSEAFKIRTDAPKLNGTYYKVQIIALANFNRNDKRYDSVRKLGRIDYEFISDKGLTRVLLGDFRSKAEAQDILNTASQNGYSGAFIVKYKNGERIGMSR